MTAEWVAASASIVSAVVALLAMVITIILHRSSDSARKIWELDQDKKRNRWQKDL